MTSSDPYTWRIVTDGERMPARPDSPSKKAFTWVAWNDESYPVVHQGHQSDNPVAMADAIELVRERCAEHGWSILTSQPRFQNINDDFVAEVRNQDYALVGFAASPISNLRAILDAYQNALAPGLTIGSP